MPARKKEYAVGKGKPPKHSQWKKGQSGNPSGKGGASRAEQAVQIKLYETVGIALGLKPDYLRTSRTRDVMAQFVQVLCVRAMDGNYRAGKLLLDLIKSAEKATLADPLGSADANVDSGQQTPDSLPQGKSNTQNRRAEITPAEQSLGDTPSADAGKTAGNDPGKPAGNRAGKAAGNGAATTAANSAAHDAPQQPERPKRPTIWRGGKLIQQGD